MAIRDGDRIHLRGKPELEGTVVALIWLPHSDTIIMEIQWDDELVSKENPKDIVKIKRKREITGGKK